MIIGFLKSVGISEKDAENWETIHTIEINENDPPLVDLFEMNCFLPDEIFTTSEWVFKFSNENFFTLFEISGHAICCALFNTGGLKNLPKNILNLSCVGYDEETFNEHFQELKNLPRLKSISIRECIKIKNISLLKNLVNLQSLNLGYCLELIDISSLSGLVNLQILNLESCESLTDISGLSGLVNLQTLNLKRCELLTDISGLSGLVNLQWLNLRWCKLLTDISSLSGLFNLQTLDLECCLSLLDVSGLTRLVNLQSINFSTCHSLTDISKLSSLVNLKTLNLEFCHSLTDIGNLFSLVNLKKLNFLNCRSLKDISGLSGLVNLQSLTLSGCESLTDVSSLSGLLNLQTLNLGNCKLLKDISGLSGLLNLRSLSLSGCGSHTDVSSLSGMLNLTSLCFSSKSLTDISGLSDLVKLESLNLEGCKSLTDISVLSGLVKLQSLDLEGCKSLTDISVLSGLVKLQSLNLDKLGIISGLSGLIKLQRLSLSSCASLTDISGLARLSNLQKLDLTNCESLTDISGLSGFVNLQTLDFQNCKSLTDISSLSGLVKLQSLNLEDCKRIQNYSSLRNCLALKELKESIMHPVESAELLCFLAVQRKDIPFILEKSNSWLQELKLGFRQKYSSTNDLACSLAQGIILTKLKFGLLFHQTLLGHNNVNVVPWKVWFSQILKDCGWDVFNEGAELNKPSELTFGAIGGISSCLPSLEGDTVQIAWAKKWISEIHSLHNTNPNFLKPAAAEWCLALKRLGEDELLREWIEKFTDPSDPSALDPINKVFSAYALDLNDSESALGYAFKINDPKLRDESILNLAQQFIKEGDTTKAGEFLFLLTQVESRTQLAYSLAEDAAYLKNDENAHRLLAACGDNPQSLASILDKLRLANPASEILKIMYEKLSNEIGFSLSDEAIALEAVVVISKLSKVTDSTFLNEAKKAMETLLKNKPNYV
jgi:Leucine-rich repeat (LRR) protein